MYSVSSLHDMPYPKNGSNEPWEVRSVADSLITLIASRRDDVRRQGHVRDADRTGARVRTFHVLTRGGSGYAANQIWLMAHYHTLATA